MSLTGTDTNFTTFRSITSFHKINTHSNRLSWFGIPAPSETQLQRRSNILAVERDSSSAFKTPKTGRRAEAERVSLGQASRSRFILLMWMLLFYVVIS